MSKSVEAKRIVKMARPYSSSEIEQKLLSILRSGMLVQGPTVKEFESRISEYIGCRHAIAVNSGTAALHASILAVSNLSSKSKGAVITTPLSFAATANAVIHAGCTPLFVDVDPETFNIDPSKIEDKATDRIVAIEPVDVYGLPASLDEIKRIADSKGIAVVEDSAEAIGAQYKGMKIGRISTLSCFSTYATKNLHTGEGGFVTTNDDALADQIRMIRNQGQVSRYNHKIIGYNFRMQEIAAAIGLPQIEILDELNAKRRLNALRLKEQLESLECLKFQQVDKPKDHSWYMFAAMLDETKSKIKRDAMVSKLRENGIEADVSWPVPIHLQPYYQENYGHREGDFPVAEKICKSIFQLPIQPALGEEEIDYVASTVRNLLR